MVDFTEMDKTLPIVNLQRLIIIHEANRLGLISDDKYKTMIISLMKLFQISEKEEIKNDHQD